MNCMKTLKRYHNRVEQWVQCIKMRLCGLLRVYGLSWVWIGLSKESILDSWGGQESDWGGWEDKGWICRTIPCLAPWSSSDWGSSRWNPWEDHSVWHNEDDLWDGLYG